MHSETPRARRCLWERIIEETLCVAIMAGVAAMLIWGTPAGKTVAISQGTESAPTADDGPAARLPLAAIAESTEERRDQ